MENSKTTKSQYGTLLNLAAIIIIIAGVMNATTIIAPILLALFISVICAQPILWLSRNKVPRTLAVIIVLLLVVAIFFGFGKLIGTSLSSFSKEAPFYEKHLNTFWITILQFFNNNGIDISSYPIDTLLDSSKILGLTANLLSQLGSFMGNALTIFFLSLFLLLEIDSIVIKTKAIVKVSEKSLSYLTEIVHGIRHYLSIKTVTSFITGLFIWIVMTIIGLDYAILWALIAFLLNYVPNIGSILAAIPAILFALIQMGVEGVLWTTAAFVIVNVVIGNVVEPRIMGKGMGLSVFVVLISLIFWGYILGTVGMFLSVPLTMAIKIILSQNPRTQWIAILLGTQYEADAILKT